MTTTTQMSERIWTRNEQMTALTQIIHDKSAIPQRSLARAVWNAANGRVAKAQWDLYADGTFVLNAEMLVRVPLATIYNRIRRITGKIK